jgi:AAA family ATP:ADP antiporter
MAPIQTTPGRSRDRLAAWLRGVVLIRRGEGRLAAWSTVHFFLVLASYYILRPMREELGLRAGLENLPWLVMGTLGAMLVCSLAMAGAGRVMRREAVAFGTYGVFIACIVGFYVAFIVLPVSWHIALARGFYIWTGVFNLLSVSVFWTFTGDILSREQAARLFALIAVGGTVGAVLGSSITAALSVVMSPVHLMPISAVALLLGVIAAVASRRSSGHVRGESERGVAPAVAQATRATVGVGRVRAYLGAICVYMLLFTMTSMVLYFEQASIVSASISGAAERTAFFARIDLFANAIAVLAQLGLSGRVLSRFGVGAALSLTPAATLLAAVALMASPTVGVLLIAQVARRAVHYAIDRPARELAFLALPGADRAASKGFVDSFVYRGGDMLGAALCGIAAADGRVLLVAAVPASLVWVGVAITIGRMQRGLGTGVARSSPDACIPSVERAV